MTNRSIHVSSKIGCFDPRYSRSTGVTLAEVMIAIFILAMALIPVFGLMTQDVKDTDTLVAYSFAVDRARLIMGTLLDDIPFSHLMPGNPAIITGPDATKQASILFPGAAPTAGGFACMTTLADPRGISYQIYLRSDPIEDRNPGYESEDFFFDFYNNPAVEDQVGWQNIVASATAMESGGSPQPASFRKGAPTNPLGLLSPYKYYDIAGQPAASFWGPDQEVKLGAARKPQDQRVVVSTPNADGRFYIMQRLSLQIRWNLAFSEYSRPTSDQGRPQRIHIIAFKAKLD